ncbi:MAG: hypothetical protein U0836_13620 [Pirellulales bacterium]
MAHFVNVLAEVADDRAGKDRNRCRPVRRALRGASTGAFSTNSLSRKSDVRKLLRVSSAVTLPALCIIAIVPAAVRDERAFLELAPWFSLIGAGFVICFGIVDFRAKPSESVMLLFLGISIAIHSIATLCGWIPFRSQEELVRRTAGVGLGLYVAVVAAIAGGRFGR